MTIFSCTFTLQINTQMTSVVMGLLCHENQLILSNLLHNFKSKNEKILNLKKIKKLNIKKNIYVYSGLGTHSFWGLERVRPRKPVTSSEQLRESEIRIDSSTSFHASIMPQWGDSRTVDKGLKNSMSKICYRGI